MRDVMESALEGPHMSQVQGECGSRANTCEHVRNALQASSGGMGQKNSRHAKLWSLVKHWRPHMSQVQGECGSSAQAKQKRCPQGHSGSQCTSPATRTARPQCGTPGHQRTMSLSCSIKDECSGLHLARNLPFYVSSC